MLHDEESIGGHREAKSRTITALSKVESYDTTASSSRTRRRPDSLEALEKSRCVIARVVYIVERN